MGRDQKIALRAIKLSKAWLRLSLHRINPDWRTIEKAVPIEAAIGRRLVLGKHQPRAGNCVAKRTQSAPKLHCVDGLTSFKSIRYGRIEWKIIPTPSPCRVNAMPFT